MYFITSKIKVYLILFLFIININEDVFALKNKNKNKNKNKIKILSDLQPDDVFVNPWLTQQHLFAFTTYHGSGVYNDLGGLVQDSNDGESDLVEAEFYRFPTGKCPVYGKVLILLGGEDFHHTAISDNFSSEHFLEYLKTGKIPGNNRPIGLNMPVEQLSKTIKTFKNLKSPEKKKSIYECALHAKKFEHPIPTRLNIKNCSINGREQSCVKHPFIYDMLKKMCYILFPLWQHKRMTPNEELSIYYPFKSFYTNYYVFGSSSIESDWEKFCPKKPIKDAAFGVWLNNNCYQAKLARRAAPFNECVEMLFKFSPSDGYKEGENNNLNKISRRSNGEGVNWANWYNNTCDILEQKPDCLYYSKNNIALTSIGIVDSLQYDLAPCISASETWSGETLCGNSVTEIFICTNGKWINKNNKTIEECQNNVEKIILEKHPQMSIKNDEEKSNILPKQNQSQQTKNQEEQNIDTSIESDSSANGILKESSSGDIRSWQNGGIISIIFLLITCLN